MIFKEQENVLDVVTPPFKMNIKIFYLLNSSQSNTVSNELKQKGFMKRIALRITSEISLVHTTMKNLAIVCI